MNRIRAINLAAAIVMALVLPAIADIRGVPCDIAGAIVDEAGRPLRDVQVEVIITELVDLAPVRVSTNVLVSERFSFQFARASQVSLVARKDGYGLCTINLNRYQLSAKDVLIKLAAAPPVTRLIQVDQAEMRAHYDGTATGLSLAAGEIVALSNQPEMFVQFPVDWSVASSNPPQSARLCMAAEGGLQPLVRESQKYTDYTLLNGVEAPEMDIAKK